MIECYFCEGCADTIPNTDPNINVLQYFMFILLFFSAFKVCDPVLGDNGAMVSISKMIKLFSVII